MKNLFPIGTVVLLKGAGKRIMIYGRFQVDAGTDETFDYIGCYYPEGLQSSSELLLFNHEEIELLYFIGFQDVEEFEYRERIAKHFEEQGESTGAINESNEE